MLLNIFKFFPLIDSSKDSSLQSDTSIESEDSFASVIYIPKKPETQSNKMPSVPTSPLIMPCPTPIHSPAPITNQRQISAKETTRFTFECPLNEKSETQRLQTKLKPDVGAARKVSTTLRMNGSGISTIITPPSPASFSVSKNNSPLPSKHLMPKITRQTIKDLPPIPKFKKLSSFPIVRRISSNNSNVVVPKLFSLELFNPETDDLDSDSSEPSSPDSIDSVINALQPQSSNSPTEPLLSNDDSGTSVTKPIAHETISNSCKSTVAPLIEAAAVVANKLEDAVEMVIREQASAGKNVFEDGDLANAERIIINQNDINLNVELTHQQHHLTNGNNNNSMKPNGDGESENFDNRREHLVDFAEKLSAQLLKELDETTEAVECGVNDGHPSDGKDNKEDPYLRKINGEIRNLSLLRDELRERRLMLANLSSKQHSSQELESYTSTPPTTIQELEEDDSPPLSAKIQSHMSQNPTLISNLGTPQAAKKQQQKINDFIPEENEENDEDESSKADEDSSLRSRISFSHLSYNATNNNFSNTHDTALLLQEDSFDEVDNSSSIGLQQMKQNLLKNIKHPNKLSDSNNNSNTNSCDSWANSNSTTASLDSPSVGGGSATHHRYYHVFREGELDALINKHVGNLHIVSSYYERASWCVVCEKVQVWTI